MDKARAIKTGERIGVEVIKASIFPTDAPLLNNPIPSGIVPHEHNGRMLPIPTDLNKEPEDFPPKCF